MVQSKNRSKLTIRLLLIGLILSQSLYSQESSDESNVIRKYLYNDITVILGDSALYTGFISDINTDSLLILAKGAEKSISYKDISNVTFTQPTNFNGSVWSGFFMGMYLGNVLFYQSDHFYYGYPNPDEPYALVTRDYPEQFGAIAINVLFGFAGMMVEYIITPYESGSTIDFSEDEAQRSEAWSSFYKKMTGVRVIPDTRVHFSITAGRLINRVLDPYTDGERQLMYSQRLSGYYNFVRKIQLSVDIFGNIRFGASLFFEGEPSVAGAYLTENKEEYSMVARYDAKGFYAAISYVLLPRKMLKNFELVVGAGIGQLAPKLKLRGSRYIYDDEQLWKIDYSTPQVSGILFAEFHYHMTDHFSLLYSIDISRSSEISVDGDENYGVPEQTFTFGNSSFGLGVGFHF
jgi:hypothetical protein